MTETPDADETAFTADLLRDLQHGRDALLWKLDGLSEYDLRRPMVPTGTNLLGLVKHTASVEAGYLGDVFGRPSPEPTPWLHEDAEDNADMWATPEQDHDWVAAFYRRVWAHSDTTLRELPLTAVGQVPWWPPERRQVSLHQIVVHVIAETHRHAGQADLVRELIDGTAGLSAGNSNLPPGNQQWWRSYHDRLEAIARAADEGLEIEDQ